MALEHNADAAFVGPWGVRGDAGATLRAALVRPGNSRIFPGSHLTAHASRRMQHSCVGRSVSVAFLMPVCDPPTNERVGHKTSPRSVTAVQTRTALMTGRYPYNTGLMEYGHGVEEERSAVPASFHMLPRLLKQAPVPYRTYHVGKVQLVRRRPPAAPLFPPSSCRHPSPPRTYCLTISIAADAVLLPRRRWLLCWLLRWVLCWVLCCPAAPSGTWCVPK